ncbi:MAG: hypothetical protein SGARI_006002, partial [Bacillariaceae sp.]
MDLQSQVCLDQHKQGRRHCRRLFDAGLASSPYPDAFRAAAAAAAEFAYSPYMEKDEFLVDLALGRRYRNIVILTGAGVSTSAGVPDYRSGGGGGVFEQVQKDIAARFPDVKNATASSPEVVFSREFANNYPGVFYDEILPAMHEMFRDLQPTPTHRFCSYLAKRGWLKRLYTQNVDGLHTHPSLDMDEDLVVECHGSMQRGDLVLYGDSLPQRFFDSVSTDFVDSNSQRVDLVMVFGTSLRVKPFCGIPNLAPKRCHRVLVNQNLNDCFTGDPCSDNSSC